ncbi:MAG: competence/damage-inducible protein A, partial [Alphaproteobacteria bacterium]|nr:competence/damage-inducible protein A [Alphaproteobacteria bacterium]
FWIGNVITMAGVPAVMHAMLDEVAPKLATGVKVLAESVDAQGLPEGAYAAGLAELAKNLPEISLGSYPSLVDGKFNNQIVLRGRDAAALTAAAGRVRELLATLTAG